MNVSGLNIKELKYRQSFIKRLFKGVIFLLDDSIHGDDSINEIDITELLKLQYQSQRFKLVEKYRGKTLEETY